MTHILSKTTFMYGCQCKKRLFLHRYHKELRNPLVEGEETKFQSGIDVGELARKLFNYGVSALPSLPNGGYPYYLAVANTQKLIYRGVDIIYEAAFEYEGVMCAVDMLVKNGKHWYAFEVKSSLSIKPEHLRDAALQYDVITKSGLALEDISIIYLNREYVRQGKLDIKQLFTTESVLDPVLEQQAFIETSINSLKTMLAGRCEPVMNIGPHCFEPYECDFTNYCWAHMPKENSVFDFFRSATAWKLIDAGHLHLDEIPADYELTETQTLHLAQHRSGEVHIDKAAIAQFLETITYPIYFFDFETINPGIPEFDGSSPYQQIPFQFSLHVLETPGTPLQHVEYLGDGITDPRPALVNAMIDHLGIHGSIVCYNMGFEKGCIRALAQLYPQYTDALLNIHERIVDLMIPFQQRWYHHSAFEGSHSIKNVLPVLVPELRYDELEIQHGTAASTVYAQLKWQDEATQDVQRQALLNYCKMDTLAMVRIWEVLKACL